MWPPPRLAKKLDELLVNCRSWRTLTCSGMPVAMRGQMPVTIPARYRITSGTRISSTRWVHRVGADALQGLLALTIHGTSQKVPDFRQQVSWIVAWPTFDSGKVRGASNIGGLPDTE